MPFLEDETAVSAHPLAVQPLGNAFLAKVDLRHNAGSFAMLPDEQIIQVLEWLDTQELVALGHCCKTLYALCYFDDLWKSMSIKAATPFKSWHGSWRTSCLHDRAKDMQYSLKPVICNGVYSDVLYRPFYCAQIDLRSYAENIPARNNISRLSDLSPKDFNKSWVSSPFILTEPVKSWPCYKSWTLDSLVRDHANVSFIAEAVQWPISLYAQYVRNTIDESPLYLFDKAFVEKMSVSSTMEQSHAKPSFYTPPECFREDLFKVLGSSRPDHRWLIVGPKRSGSTFHKDPNATSAWNAVLTGSKYWIMFPSASATPPIDAYGVRGDPRVDTTAIPPPPGVFISSDESEVTSPLSIAEWLMNFHAQARRTPGCKEGICYAGEVLHVPSGWWHLVVNLEESVAITQNFVPRTHLSEVLNFLRDKSDQVSGFPSTVANPFALFKERLGAQQADMLESGLKGMRPAPLQRVKPKGRRRWDEITGPKHLPTSKPCDMNSSYPQTQNSTTNENAFQFGFGGDYDDDE